MDILQEPKPIKRRKGNEEYSEYLVRNVPASIKNDEMPTFSNDNNNSKSENRKEEVSGEKFFSRVVSNTLEQFDFEDQERQNGSNITNKIKIGDKNDDEIEYCEDGLKLHPYEKASEEALKQENISEIQTEFQQQVKLQNNVSRDGSNASSIETNSSGIGNDFESHEDCSEKLFIENQDKIHNIYQEPLTKENSNVESSNLTKDYSCEKENENLENSGFGKKIQGKINMANVDITSADEGVVSYDVFSLFEAIKFPYKNPSNAFDVIIPLIGKNLITVGDIKPFKHRYDLATEINRIKGIKDVPFMPKINYHEWRKQREARPQEEKDKEERYEKFIAIKTAVYITQISVSILQEMQNDNPDEELIERCFLRFLGVPASTLSLILSSQFVHVMMYIRGSSDFSYKLRHIADQCFMKCHVMFPIPYGYNFETVYTSEIMKNLPDKLNGMHNFILDYGNFEYPVLESNDSAFSDDNEN